MINKKGMRSGIAIILLNDQNKVFWAKRIGQNAFQFPQGGVQENETPEETMYRELYEEVGLKPKDVQMLGQSKDWLRYHLPKQFIRVHSKPLCVGQRLKWFLLRLVSNDDKINFKAFETPEFDGYLWVDYWLPLKQIIPFKRHIYKKALTEFEPIVFPDK
jgi:putative (di)nucleoside polyphosphate hydrolase